MSQLLVHPGAPDPEGRTVAVTPASAGWGHVGFEVVRLAPGQSIRRDTGDREACLVLIAGRADIAAGDQTWSDIGERMSPFEGKRPCSVYVPAGQSYQVTARTELELGVCTAPGGGSHQARLIPPDQVAYTKRGVGTNVRHVYDILPETEPAHSLLVVEVITPAGQLVQLPAPQARRRRIARGIQARGDLLSSDSTRPRGSRFSGSTPTTASWTKPWRSATAMS